MAKTMAQLLAEKNAQAAGGAVAPAPVAAAPKTPGPPPASAAKAPPAAAQKLGYDNDPALVKEVAELRAKVAAYEGRPGEGGTKEKLHTAAVAMTGHAMRTEDIPTVEQINAAAVGR